MNKDKILGMFSRELTSEIRAVKLYGNMATMEVSSDILTKFCDALYHKHRLPLKTIAATDERAENRGFGIFYVFGIPGENFFLAPFIQIKEKDTFPSIVSAIHEASRHERKIKTFFGIMPEGHPDPQPIHLHENWPENIFPLRKDFPGNTRPPAASANTPYTFLKVEGEGIYEIPVGPVHAGIIEPGHFRFSVAGEEIILLEPRLGYTHKGSEKLFETLPLHETIRLSERISGDSSFSHSLAYCQALESLSGCKVPERAKYLRVIYAEMERLENHFGDIGAIMTDTGFNFGGSHGGRLREMLMQWNERLTGSRFLRGVNTQGGVTKNIASANADFVNALRTIEKDFSEVIEIARHTSSFISRLQDAGTLSHDIAIDHGAIGVAGRAAGIPVDARLDYPYAAYGNLSFEKALEKSGDVHARFFVRVKEVFSSFHLIRQAFEKMPPGDDIVFQGSAPLTPDAFSLGIAEGWRGDIVYFVATDARGNISRVDVRDPSFLNWALLSHAAKGNVVPDFPLINKSFNLSYSGNDL